MTSPVVPSAEEPVSPELALVDSELASRARAGLPEATNTLDRLKTERVAESTFPVGTTHELAAQSEGREEGAAFQRLAMVELDSSEYEFRERRALRPFLAAAFGLTVAALVGTLAFGERASDLLRSSPKRAEAGASVSDVTAGTPSATGAAGGTAEQDRAPGQSGGTGAGASMPTASTTTRQVAEALRRASESTVSPPSTARLWWPAANGITGYSVELYRDGVRVFVSRTSTNGVAIPETWTAGGRKLRRDPGDTLYIWPLRAGKRLEKPLYHGLLIDFL
jgi:hypothetical protein